MSPILTYPTADDQTALSEIDAQRNSTCDVDVMANHAYRRYFIIALLVFVGGKSSNHKDGSTDDHLAVELHRLMDPRSPFCVSPL